MPDKHVAYRRPSRVARGRIHKDDAGHETRYATVYISARPLLHDNIAPMRRCTFRVCTFDVCAYGRRNIRYCRCRNTRVIREASSVFIP